jgi:aspartyl-tRNA(Asn)/glutamyl-tRNA(Gln) amidotransferase subunit B
MNHSFFEHWEAVIGLEVHVQLETKSKIFSSAPNRFGDEPNMNISEVCTGQPGALPVLNEETVKKAVLFGLAVHADISSMSTFDRKSYFYPDSPRNFQITQFENPIIKRGIVQADVEGKMKEFSIKEAHLEDDAGMLKHFSTFCGVDYNRAGVPLLEIVSEPCMTTAKEAVAYVTAVKAIMEYLNASNCNMEEGSLRVDANVSVRPKGATHLRAKTEIKNMNSFSLMEMAIETEILRQIHLYTEHPHEDYAKVITSGTYRFDPQRKEMILMRRKETAEDYRYFPEPDLPPLILTKTYIENIRKELPELPHERFKRYTEQLHLTEYSASVLINDKPLCEYFEKALQKCAHPQNLCNWITIEFAGRFKERNKDLTKSKILPEHIAKLVSLIEDKTITGKIAKAVADEMMDFEGKDPLKIIQENPNYQPVSDTDVIEKIVDQVLKDNPESVQDFKNGKTKAFGFLVGQVMKHTQGKASPEIVNMILKKKIQGLG